MAETKKNETDEVEQLKQEKARLEKELEEARKPTNGLSMRDVRIVGSVQAMGDSNWYPVSVFRDSEAERKLFLDRCDELTLAPRMTKLMPGDIPPTLHPWPNVPDIDPTIPRGPSRPIVESGEW